ncbi:MAG: hypothetical protein IJ584_09065, partial [Bacteroidales bacterium]|nr:hypothetical protein [Bacteroidales bacterium]
MRHLPSVLAAIVAFLFPFSAQAGKSVYTRQFDDPQGIFFSEEAFGIKSDGRFDVSDALQSAVNKIK